MCINGSSLVGTFSGGHESISNDQTGIRARLAPLRCTKSERRGEFLPGQECGYRWGQFLVCWSRRPTVSPHPRTTSITSNSSFITFHHITLSSSPHPPCPQSPPFGSARPSFSPARQDMHVHANASNSRHTLLMGSYSSL